MIKANVIVDYSPWKLKIFNPNLHVKKRLEIILKKNFLKRSNIEFSIMLTHKRLMKNLNLKFRKKNKITDVLAFPHSKKKISKGYIGDIAICYEIVNQRSKKTNFKYEFDKMWLHGYLHLLGYDHKNNSDYNEMLNKEQTIIKDFDYKF